MKTNDWTRGLIPAQCTCLAMILWISACSRSDPAADGSGASSSSVSKDAANPNGPDSAPKDQPRFGQIGTAGISRIATNELGQRGISVNEVNAPAVVGKPADRTPDEALAEKVRVALSTGTTGTSGTYPTDALLDIGVISSNGLITLTGAVGSEGARQTLGERAKALNGVTGVDNQLTISPGAGAPGPGVPFGPGQIERLPQERKSQPTP